MKPYDAVMVVYSEAKRGYHFHKGTEHLLNVEIVTKVTSDSQKNSFACSYIIYFL